VIASALRSAGPARRVRGPARVQTLTAACGPVTPGRPGPGVTHNGDMTQPVLKTRTLVTDDGVPIDAMHLPRDTDLAIVLAHGFTLSWQHGAVWKVAKRLNRTAGVIAFDFRGHGRSGGLSTLGDRETRDLAVAVAYARELGYQRIVAVGFSMGASIVVRYAGLAGGIDAAVSVSGPGRWYYRGTYPMRRVHWAVERRLGRMITRTRLNTRVSSVRWNPVPMPPAEAAARIAPIPLLVVHGDKDPYFPVEHAHQLYEAAREPKELWIVPGFGHAESGSNDALLDRIAAWADKTSAARRAAEGGDAQAERAGAA
jgi:pimeloyl-ACP methyl ester carboxylesterase